MAKKKAATPKPGGATKRKRSSTPTKRQTTPKTAPKKKAKPSLKKRRAAKRKATKKANGTTGATPTVKGPQADAHPTAGGDRGNSALTDPAINEMRRSDMATIGSAIRNRRVNVRDDAVEACLNRAARIGLSTTKERNALAATRLLLTAVQINQADEHKGLPDKIQVDARVMTVEGQRAALLTAIAAEREKRARRAKK